MRGLMDAYARWEQDVFLKGPVDAQDVADYLASMTSFWGQPVFDATVSSGSDWTLEVAKGMRYLPSADWPGVLITSHSLESDAEWRDRLKNAAEWHAVQVDPNEYEQLLIVENRDPEVVLFFNTVDRLASWDRFEDTIVVHQHPGFALHTQRTGWIGADNSGAIEVTINGERQT